LLKEFTQAGEHLLADSGSRKLANLSLLLPEEVRSEITDTASPYAMLRAIVDFVSGLTDKHAITLYRKIKGYSF
jgi:dGTPase